MANISFNSANVSAIAKKIRTNVGTIEEDLKKIDELCNNVQLSWKGQDSESYVQKVMVKKADISSIIPCLTTLADKLDRYAAGMQQNQQDIIAEGNKI